MSRPTSRGTVLGLHDSEHRAFLRDHGIGDRAEIYLRTSGSVAADVALLRPAGEPRFTSASPRCAASGRCSSTPAPARSRPRRRTCTTCCGTAA